MKQFELFFHGKQGDNLDDFLNKSDSAAEAFSSMASYYRDMSEAMTRIAGVCQEWGIEKEAINADTHLIGIDCSTLAQEALLEAAGDYGNVIDYEGEEE